MVEFFFAHSPLLYFTQSLWRDEAFSILVAERYLTSVLAKLTFEPPVYYVLLHYWIRIFGESEIAARSLSLLGVLLATILVIIWSEKLLKKSWLSWFLPIFFFFNPMLLYYAFEVRTYGWYIFFVTLSMYAYIEKKWLWYFCATVLGFYTHSYFLFTFATQLLHYVIIHYRTIFKSFHWKSISTNPMLKASALSLLCFAPWIARIARESAKLHSSWYYPVDFHLIKSVLGNMFVGYEGTPWYLWDVTVVLSLVLLSLFVISLRHKGTRARNLYFIMAVFIPLTIVIGVSFIKPLFVNRYLISVTVAEIFLVVFALESVRNKYMQVLSASLFLFGVLAFNIWYPDKHPKVDIRNTLAQVNMLRGKTDVVFATSSLVFFESLYYSNDRSVVYLYNPNGSSFPWYVGDIIFSEEQGARDLPTYPTRAFMIHEDGTYSINFKSLDTTGNTTINKSARPQ